MIGITGYLYQMTRKEDGKGRRFKLGGSLAIVLSASVISSHIPVAEILENCQDVVILLPPSIQKEDLKGFGISIDDTYKIIECDTEIGMIHIMKHLHYTNNFICLDDLDINEGDLEKLQLKRFVANVVYLEQNKELILDEFDKYIANR